MVTLGIPVGFQAAKSVNEEGAGMADVEQYRATFEMVDVDGDGYVSAAEFQNLMRALGQEISHARSVEIVVAADRNGDGKISLEEFAAFMAGNGA